MKTHAMLSFDCVTNLYLLLRGRQLSFELDVLLPKGSHCLVEPIGGLLELFDKITRLLVGCLERTNNALSSGNGWRKTETHNIVAKAGTELVYLNLFNFQLFCIVLLPLG